MDGEVRAPFVEPAGTGLGSQSMELVGSDFHGGMRL